MKTDIIVVESVGRNLVTSVDHTTKGRRVKSLINHSKRRKESRWRRKGKGYIFQDSLSVYKRTEVVEIHVFE